jgi:hypothetical protein
MTEIEKQILEHYEAMSDDELALLPQDEYEEFSDLMKQSIGERERASIQDAMPGGIQSARAAQLQADYPDMEYSHPEAYRAMMEGREPTTVEYAKGTFSAPGRLLATIGETDFESMKTPYTERQGAIERTITSPTTGAAIAAAPVAAALSGKIPVTPWTQAVIAGGLEGGGAIGAAKAFEEDYGIANAAVDAAISLIVPGFGPTLRRLGANFAKKAIARILEAKGTQATIGLVDKVYEAVTSPKFAMTSNKKLARDMRVDASAGLAVDMQPGALVSDKGLEYAKADIQASLGNGPFGKQGLGPQRSIDEYEKDMGRLSDFSRKQGILKEALQPTISTDPLIAISQDPLTLNQYRKHMSGLASQYADIPELVQALEQGVGSGQVSWPQYLSELRAANLVGDNEFGNMSTLRSIGGIPSYLRGAATTPAAQRALLSGASGVTTLFPSAVREVRREEPMIPLKSLGNN